MRIQYCSDLHLEFKSNWNWLKENPIQPTGNILLVAGDTYYLGEEFAQHQWFDFASEHWEQVYLIPGNHEFYDGYDADVCMVREYEIAIRDNVTLVNNTTKEIGNTCFIFSCMWSKIENEVGPILGSLNDFRLINFGKQKLNVQKYNAMFEYSWHFLKDAIESNRAQNTIVVTHHLPSVQCNLEIYKNSKLNEAFCVDLTDEIEKSTVDYWIYGHSHGNVPAFKIGSTTMLTNQLGYVHIKENRNFRNNAFFTIES